jgi:hypothetical protein
MATAAAPPGRRDAPPRKKMAARPGRQQARILPALENSLHLRSHSHAEGPPPCDDGRFTLNLGARNLKKLLGYFDEMPQTSTEGCAQNPMTHGVLQLSVH